jgi:hypothetical protein
MLVTHRAGTHIAGLKSVNANVGRIGGIHGVLDFMFSGFVVFNLRIQRFRRWRVFTRQKSAIMVLELKP